MVMRVLISVSDKTGIVDFAQRLSVLGAEIVSTGGTAALLQHHAVAVTLVEEVTGFPEVMNGRVKTLHPYIYASILCREGVAEDRAVLQEYHLQAFDLVVVNLYPFKQVIDNAKSTRQEIIENIDIGGPCMIRAAAKNHHRVAVLVDINDYSWVVEDLEKNSALSQEQRFQLSSKAFRHCADYDTMIANWFVQQQNTARSPSPDKVELAEKLHLLSDKKQALRYGENPHQPAAFYPLPNAPKDCIANIRQHQGKPLSYNNIMDADVALELVKTLAKSACVIVKHNSPCGVAETEDALTSYQLAFACDCESAFGGIIALNQLVTAREIEAMINNQFFELIIAPEYTEEALDLLTKKENVRVLQYQSGINPADGDKSNSHNWEVRQVGGGLLYQYKDRTIADGWSVVTTRQPDRATWEALIFSWNVVRFVKSNAIVYSQNGQTLGIGGGQTSRVMSVELAIIKAQKAGFDLSASVMASDAFFPFKDSIELAGENGVQAIIQPGGSVRDEEVIEEANKYDMTMVFTHHRCFKH